MFKKGDTLTAKFKVGIFESGDTVEVTNVNNNGMISFVFGDNQQHMGVLSKEVCEQIFEKVESKTEAPKVSFERVDWIMNNSQINVQTVFDKCTIVSCKLPNGFVIVESSACVSPENYSKDIGVDICLDKIRDKIWELEGYVLQESLYDCDDYSCCDCNCEDCDCEHEEEFCVEEEFIDCDECDDYDCPSNPKHYS